MSTIQTFIPRLFLLASLLAFCVFVGISFGVYAGRFVSTDFTLTVKLQDKMPARLTNEFGYFVDIGSNEVMTGLLVITLFVLPLKKRVKFLVCCLYVAGLGVVLLQKTTFHHPAPPYMFHRDSPGMHFPSSYVQIQYSFPSGHTYRSFFVATLIAAGLWYTKRSLLFKGIVTTIVLGIASAIALALVILGKHWTSDIIGGWSLAVFLVLGFLPLAQRFFPKKNQ